MNGWTAVDLDGTLAYDDGWQGPEHIGAPIPAMVERVRTWLAEGHDVRIFTARVARSGRQNGEGVPDDDAFATHQTALIQAWCVTQFGRSLPVTATKDLAMRELWDDRCVHVAPNTGNPPDWMEVRRPTDPDHSALFLALVNQRGDFLRVETELGNRDLRDLPLDELIVRYIRPAIAQLQFRLRERGR